MHIKLIDIFGSSGLSYQTFYKYLRYFINAYHSNKSLGYKLPIWTDSSMLDLRYVRKFSIPFSKKT